MYTSFMNNQVPALWTRVSFASLKSLASWNKDLLFRWDTSVDMFNFRFCLVKRRGIDGRAAVPRIPATWLKKTSFRLAVCFPKRAVMMS